MKALYCKNFNSLEISKQLEFIKDPGGETYSTKVKRKFYFTSLSSTIKSMEYPKLLIGRLIS